ncbi:MAG: SDR family oxidoreductase [Lachnospiraceae bacterium]
MMKLEGKVAIITGANSGIGEETAQLLAKEGAKVIIAARRVDKLEAVARKINDEGGTCIAFPVDISNADSCELLVETAVEKFGKLDILVNNAGVLEKGMLPIDKYLDEDLSRNFEINTKGTMHCIRSATKAMLNNKGGSIVNVASIAAVVGCGGASYVASKAALIGVARHTAIRFASKGIRCNSVCPGNVVTPMTKFTDPATLDAEFMGEMRKHCDLSLPPCMPEDIANVILFLASDDSRALTGQVLTPDYGSNL